MKSLYTSTLGLALAAGISLPVLASVTIDWVTVGNVGNFGDSGGFGFNGAVGYEYQIGKYEVTNTQYTEFLNAVDPGGTNPNGIWNSDMGNNIRGGITYTSGAANGSKYSVRAHMGNKPVNYVSWYDAARFTNWLHNGQGSGSTETGAYTLDGNTGFPSKNVGATVWIPNGNEWYKAAYHDPTHDVVPAPGGDEYWTYATRSDTVPTIATADASGNISNPGANVVNYAYGAEWNGQNGNVTTVGSAGGNSASFYGTFDQGGNVWEWDDGVLPILSRGVSGGGWANSNDGLLPGSRIVGLDPIGESEHIGFRVAGVPTDFTLSVSVLTNGSVTGAGSYPSGATATLMATPAPGYLLTGWTGDATGTVNPLSVLMDADKTISANFSPDTRDDDEDGLTNYQEIVELGTSPALKDTDSDGLTDGAEFLTYHTNPKVGDTDGDGFLDGYEVLTGKLPLDPLDYPALVAEARTAIEFTFPSALGKTYRIEGSPDLSTWTTVEDGIPGNGGVIQRFYSTRNVPKRYFRVVEDGS